MLSRIGHKSSRINSNTQLTLNLELHQKMPDLPKRPVDADKHTFGTVVVVGGDITQVGTLAVCITAALRAGAGCCKLLATKEVLQMVLVMQPCCSGILLDDNPAEILKEVSEMKGKVTLIIGSGCGREESQKRVLRELIKSKLPIVLDSDALAMVAEDGDTLRKIRPKRSGLQPFIVTPDSREFCRLAGAVGISESPTDPVTRPLCASLLADSHNSIVVLKGSNTVVSDGSRCYINHTGNPALGIPCSGSVLSGIIASLNAQGCDAYDSAVLGTYLHGLCADRWATTHGHCGLLATELCDILPDTIHAMRLLSEKQAAAGKKKDAK